MKAPGHKSPALNQHPGWNNEATLVDRGWGFVGAVMVLVALAMPSFGPVVDHHFAERQFHHGHLLLGTVPADHEHLSPGSYHRHGTGTRSSTDGPDNYLGIVYLNSADGGSPVVVTAPTATETNVAYPGFDGALFGAGYSAAEHPITGIFPSLPEPPPRTRPF